MIYSHSVIAWDADGTHLARSPTRSTWPPGTTRYPLGMSQGGPVELAFSPDRTKAYTSNYSMYGPGFSCPGDDRCSPSSGFDSSFVYRIDGLTHAIDQVILVGSVPKYVATTPDGRYVPVTNWCTYDMSVIDAAAGREVRGRSAATPGASPSRPTRAPPTWRPGRTEIVTVPTSLRSPWPVRGRRRRAPARGDQPRRCLPVRDAEPGRAHRQGRRHMGEVLATVATGTAPRSMDIAADGQSLYVVELRVVHAVEGDHGRHGRGAGVGDVTTPSASPTTR